MVVEIITPENQEKIDDVSLVQLPGVDGLFEILQNHAPLIAILAKGKAKIINKSNDTKFFPIEGGVVEVLRNKITILTERC